MTLPARLTALAIFTLILVALRARFDLTAAEQGFSAAKTLWLLAGYLTILTLMFVAGVMAAAALNRPIGAVLATSATLSILMVAIIYHLVLARLRTLEGFEFWVDQALHTAVPLLTFGWWLAFAPRSLTYRDLPALVAWPLIYTAYAMARGVLTGFWPYPFLDLDSLGRMGVLTNLLVILAAFLTLGAGLVALSRRLSR